MHYKGNNVKKHKEQVCKKRLDDTSHPLTITYILKVVHRLYE